jgi:putative addiction module component (TIGR02574 family)
MNVVTRSAADVLADALSLDQEQRAEIAAQLIASLDGPAEDDVNAAWAAEVARRMAEIDAGKTRTEPWDVVLRRIEIDSLRQ